MSKRLRNPRLFVRVAPIETYVVFRREHRAVANACLGRHHAPYNLAAQCTRDDRGVMTCWDEGDEGYDRTDPSGCDDFAAVRKFWDDCTIIHDDGAP